MARLGAGASATLEAGREAPRGPAGLAAARRAAVGRRRNAVARPEVRRLRSPTEGALHGVRPKVSRAAGRSAAERAAALPGGRRAHRRRRVAVPAELRGAVPPRQVGRNAPPAPGIHAPVVRRGAGRRGVREGIPRERRAIQRPDAHGCQERQVASRLRH